MAESKTLPRLFIIDFDLAQSVESEETMTEGWCGTPPWVAPELGSINGPTQRYSPILADRWACGQMIQHFTKYFPTYEGERKTMLRAFAQRLLYLNPRARPALNELRAIDGPKKRNSARSQEEPVPKRHASCSESVCLLSNFVFESNQVMGPAARSELTTLNRQNSLKAQVTE
jgi:serine/threonine protein kinase